MNNLLFENDCPQTFFFFFFFKRKNKCRKVFLKIKFRKEILSWCHRTTVRNK